MNRIKALPHCDHTWVTCCLLDCLIYRKLKQGLNTNASVTYLLSYVRSGIRTTHVVTDRAILELRLRTLYTRQFQLNSSVYGPYFHFNRNWVTCKRGKVLWLPPDYRVTCSAAQYNILALGHASGRVTFLGFHLDSIPLNE